MREHVRKHLKLSGLPQSPHRTNTLCVLCTNLQKGRAHFIQPDPLSVGVPGILQEVPDYEMCMQTVHLREELVKYQCPPLSTYLHGHSHCGLLPTVKALCTQCLLEIVEVHLQKVPVVLSSSDTSEDGETEEPKEQASSILQRKQFQVKINCIHSLYHDLRVALLLVPLARSIWYGNLLLLHMSADSY